MTSDTSTGSANVRTFLFADMRGYTSFTGEHGDEAASALASRFADIVQAVAPEFDGELVELRGDEALCVFLSTRQALRAAVALQRRLRSPADGEEAFRLPVGMGLDAGEAVPIKGGYRGSALNVAARLCATAQGGEVLATDRLVGLAGPLPEIRWGSPRELRLKGVELPVRAVPIESVEPIPPPPRLATAGRKRSVRRGWVLAGIGAAVLALAVVLAAVVSRGGGSHASAAGVVVRAPSVAVVDPANGNVVADLRLSSDPESITVGGDMAWIGSSAGTVTPVSLNTRKVLAPIGVDVDPIYLTFGRGSVWAYDGLKRIQEIDAEHRYTLGPSRSLFDCATSFSNPGGPTCAEGGVAQIGDELWIPNVNGNRATESAYVDTFSAENLSKTGQIAGVDTGPIVQGSGEAWVWGDVGRSVDQVSIADRQVVARTPLGVVASYRGGGLATGFGGAWVAAPFSGTLFGINAGDPVVARQYQLVSGLTFVATSPTAVWVGVGSGRLLRVNPFSGRYQSRRLSHDPVAAVYADGFLWVAVASS